MLMWKTFEIKSAIGFAVSADNRLEIKENVKREKNLDLDREFWDEIKYLADFGDKGFYSIHWTELNNIYEQVLK